MLYTALFVPPALVFVLSLWGLTLNVRDFILELKHTMFPARKLFLCLLLLTTTGIGLAGMVWVINLIMYRNANPSPIPSDTPACC